MPSNSDQRQPIGGIAPYSYTSSPGGIAVVDNTGVVVALAVGTTTITATDSAKPTAATASYQVNVRGAPLYIDTGTVTIKQGDTYSRKATGGTGTITYSSSRTDVATVNSEGLVTGKSAGPSSIYAADTLARVQYTLFVESSTPPVDAGPDHTVSGVWIIDIATSTLKHPIGATYQCAPSGGTGSYRYASSDTSVASINASGLVRVKGNGTATITVMDASNQSDTLTVRASGIMIFRDIGKDHRGNARSQCASAGMRLISLNNAKTLWARYAALNGSDALHEKIGLRTDGYWTNDDADATRSWVFNFAGGTELYQYNTLSFGVMGESL